MESSPRQQGYTMHNNVNYLIILDYGIQSSTTRLYNAPLTSSIGRISIRAYQQWHMIMRLRIINTELNRYFVQKRAPGSINICRTEVIAHIKYPLIGANLKIITFESWATAQPTIFISHITLNKRWPTIIQSIQFNSHICSRTTPRCIQHMASQKTSI